MGIDDVSACEDALDIRRRPVIGQAIEQTLPGLRCPFQARAVRVSR